MLWACIHLPALAVEAAFAGCAASGPRAVYDPAHRHRRLVGVDRAADALGIHAGLTSATARALAADVAIRARVPEAEQACLDTVAAMAYAFSGQVALDPPAAVLLEVGASLRLFGGWPAIDQGLRTGLDRLGHAHRLAVAPTPAAARAFAGREDGRMAGDRRALEQALRGLSLAEAGLPDEATALLSRAGLRRLGDVLALPRADLLRRVGRPVGLHLDRLSGRLDDIRPLYRPPDRFERRMEFEYGIVASDALLFPLRHLTQALAAFLSARDGGVSRFVLRFLHEGAPASELAVGLRKPMRTPQALFDAARGRLERHPLPAPAQGLALVAEHLPAFVPELRDLFEAGSRGALDHDALVEHLRARLGDDSVRQLAVAQDHRPERAWRVVDPAAMPSSPARPARRRAPLQAPSPRPSPAGAGKGAVLASPARPRLFTDRNGREATADGPACGRPFQTDACLPLPAPAEEGRDGSERTQRARVVGEPPAAVLIPHAPSRTPHDAQPPRPSDADAGDGVARRGVEALPLPATCPLASRPSSLVPPLRRPLWLLPAPVPLQARIVRTLGGSERIESGWWDAQAARRDYVVAELDTGQRAWLFREAGSEAWMVHGWFG